MQMLLAVRGGSEAAFYLLVFLHVVAALAGFGSIGFAGTYASRAVQMALAAETAPRRHQGSHVPTAPGPGVGGGDAGLGAHAELATGALADGEGGAEPGGHKVEAEVFGDGGEGADAEVEELVRYFGRPARFWKALILLPVFGVLALWAEPGGGGLDQVWDIAALLVWGAAIVVAAGVVVPSLRQVQGIVSSAPPAGAASEAVPAPPGSRSRTWATPANRSRLARYGRLASRGAAACDVLFFVALALMIWQP